MKSPDDFEEPTDDDGYSSEIYLTYLKRIAKVSLIGLLIYAAIAAVVFFWLPLLTIISREQ